MATAPAEGLISESPAEEVPVEQEAAADTSTAEQHDEVPAEPAAAVEATSEEPPSAPEPLRDIGAELRQAIEAAADALVKAGASAEEARVALAAKLEPIGEEARRRHQGGESYAEVDAWYVEAARAELAASASPAAPAPAPPPPPPGHLRRRVTTQLSAWGHTLEGHRREGWGPGEVGDFRPHVIDSAPHAFAEP